MLLSGTNLVLSGTNLVLSGTNLRCCQGLFCVVVRDECSLSGINALLSGTNLLLAGSTLLSGTNIVCQGSMYFCQGRIYFVVRDESTLGRVYFVVRDEFGVLPGTNLLCWDSFKRRLHSSRVDTCTDLCSL